VIVHLKPAADLRPLFESVGVQFPTKPGAAARPIINTCGSGMTACIVAFGLRSCGYPFESLSLYDGSWTEWGGNSELPVESFTEKPGTREALAKAGAARS
jgi:thiosulfate/3-mercaptopyruvate sulfurtransferase